MNAEELLEEWTAGESSGMRPQRIAQLRSELQNATGLPVPRRVQEIENWTDRMRGQVTKKLKDAVNEDDE